MNQLVTNPVIPVWLVVALLVAAGLGILLSFHRCVTPWRHKGPLIILRVAAVLILAALLFLPERRTISEKAEAPALAVLVDNSASMLDSPTREPRIRRQNATAFLGRREFRTVAARYRLLWYEFGGALRELPDGAAHQFTDDAPRTNLNEALNELAERTRGVNLAGVVLLTDGLDQSGVELTPEAARLPLFIPELEETEMKVERPVATDTFIAEVNHPRMLVINWRGEVDVVIKRRAAGARLVCPVTLYRQQERVRQAVVSFDPTQTVRSVTFTIEPIEVGQSTYRVEIDPPLDTNKENNKRDFSIDVTNPQNRVLYLEGTPRYEFKYLKRALLKEKAYTLSAFLQAGPGLFINFSEATASSTLTGLPELTGQEVLQFRAMILGEMTADALTPAQQQAVLSYVDKGGGLLLLGGRKAYGPTGWGSVEALRPLLPFSNRPGAEMRDGRFAVRVGPQAAAHPALSGLTDEGALPQILSLWKPVALSPAANVLIEAETGEPVLVASRYGKGKVVAVLTDSLWRWQLAASRMEEGKSLYDKFITQLAFWLTPQEKQITETANLQLVLRDSEAIIHEPLTIGAVATGRGPEARLELRCHVTPPAGRPPLDLELSAARLGAELGLTKPVWGWRAAFTPPAAGEYRITVSEKGGEKAEGKVLVIEPQLEKTGQELNRALLQDLAARSGGRFLPLAKAQELMGAIPFQTVSLRVTDEYPLWNQHWILVVLIGLFTLEWYLRGKLDLV